MTRYYFILIILLLGLQLANAQIGINTLNPDTNAVLDIKSSNKGIKLPSINNTSVLLVPTDSSGYLIYHVPSKKFKYWNGQIWESVNPLEVDDFENVTAPANVNIQGNLQVTGKTYLSDSLVNRNGVILGNRLVGNGANVTNVNASQLQSHPASYFGTSVADDSLQARITRLNNNKLDQDIFYSSPTTLSVTGKSNTTLTYSNVECYVLGRMVFIKGSICFTKSRNEDGASFAISGMPNFPSCFGCNTFSYTLYPGGTSNYSYGYGYYDRSTTVGSTNTIIFYRIGAQLTTGVSWWAKFQFFYWY